MRETGKGKIGINEVLSGIRHLKDETEKFSWLLGEELKHKIIEAIEEKENDVIENLMWFAQGFGYKG